MCENKGFRAWVSLRKYEITMEIPGVYILSREKAHKHRTHLYLVAYLGAILNLYLSVVGTLALPVSTVDRIHEAEDIPIVMAMVKQSYY